MIALAPSIVVGTVADELRACAAQLCDFGFCAIFPTGHAYVWMCRVFKDESMTLLNNVTAEEAAMAYLLAAELLERKEELE